ncbi:hypothetical protein KFK09_006810 [Dendrobium nobile]|uniref:Uncharacterized protein n=1 Tax=Dendrobium nobile TaxID=94219 RepID=A0A8T3BQ59_DENNO|nr:hypothetical protein KFK09_006810 [Dendrobium nobile]
MQCPTSLILSRSNRKPQPHCRPFLPLILPPPANLPSKPSPAPHPSFYIADLVEQAKPRTSRSLPYFPQDLTPTCSSDSCLRLDPSIISANFLHMVARLRSRAPHSHLQIEPCTPLPLSKTHSNSPLFPF